MSPTAAILATLPPLVAAHGTVSVIKAFQPKKRRKYKKKKKKRR